MESTLVAVDQYIADHLGETREDLKRLARIPSVSARGGEPMAAAADLVADLLTAAGFDARIIPSDGFPMVYGDSGGKAARTMICYNHYDVQPPEPLDLWVTPPFEPAERDGRLYARGISDDKGQLVSRIAAMRAVRAVMGGFPVRVKFIVEGEEEVGSRSLPAFIAAHADLLAADACVWETGGVDSAGRPLLTLGKRGVLCVELRARTLDRDAHSGQAHNLPNAAWHLLRALATIKDEHERIQIPGFYDDAHPPAAEARALLERMPSDEAFARAQYGVGEFVNGHTGQAYKEAVYAPTANIAGLTAGWQGPGSKTVIPAEATAKLDFRLVPDQDPADILAKLRGHLDAQGFADIDLTQLGGADHADTTPPDDPFVALTARTAEEVYGLPAVLVPLIGGSGPGYPFRTILKTPIVSLGTSDPYTAIHSPNESVSLAQFERGTRHMAHLLLAYGEAGADAH